ncbi:MAG TPA: glycine cleavage T C-terminal barrel domain-containing protein [Terriglobales bacterium]|nr:glycine cleavage T C-terminal barrel domain-containing protein [Terriglobales bacterium]
MLATAHNGVLPPTLSINTEFQALVSDCGIYTLNSRAKVLLTGDDRVRWLNGMVTNNIRDLAVGHGVYAFLLNPQGRILGDLYAYNQGDSICLDTDENQAAKILEIFDHYIIMDDVEVENVSQKLTAIGLTGPKSIDILRAAEIEAGELQPLEFRNFQWNQIPFTLVGCEQEKRQSYEIWIAPEHTQQLFGALVKHGAVTISDPTLELYRVALGLPRYGQDIRERDLPQETEQTRALNFSKGCYVGQEIVERIRSRGAVHRTFTGFLLESNSPAPGAKIQVDGKDVGEITSIATLPVHGSLQKVGLGYIRRESASAGKEVTVGDTKATVAELPFKAVFE